MSNEAEDRKTGLRYFTRDKHKEFECLLESIIKKKCNLEPYEVDETKQCILDALSDVFNYDPSLSTYDADKMAKIKAETGKSTYELYQKEYREKNLEEQRRKTKERSRLYYQRKKERIAEEKRKQEEEEEALHASKKEKVDE